MATTRTRGGRPAGPSGVEKRPLIVARGWPQAAVVVFLFGFFVLGILAYRNYAAEPPIPEKVVDESGQTLFTDKDVHKGQDVFLKNGLMEYGSVMGHGGYLGPDFTADYLHRAAVSVRSQLRGEPGAAATTREEFRANRYDEGTKTLTYTERQAVAFAELEEYYAGFFADPTTSHGLRPKPITNPAEVHEVTAFLSWTAWVSAAQRPGKNYSYTNNWPPEDLVGNTPTGSTVVWSALSLVALLCGIGLLLAAFGRWSFLGWHEREGPALRFRAPDEVGLTPGQRACAWFFLAMAALFLVQTLVGGAAQHYRADLSSFFGIDLAKWLPFNVVRTWHVQLAIFWVATSYLASGIFFAPMVAGHEPKRQHWLAFALLGALVVVVAGSLLGELAGIFGWLTGAWNLIGNQGFEYIDLGRVWQVLLTVGLAFWVVILVRGLRRRLATEHKGNMPWLMFFAALAIPAFYAVGLLARSGSTFTSNDFWRFWVVHLWVEDFLELFTTVMVAYVFVLLGVVAEKVALRLIYLDIVLFLGGGLIGTMHHMYFNGEPAETMALGAFFSAMEVIPLTFLTLESWSFMRTGQARMSEGGDAAVPVHWSKGFPHRWAVMFLASVGFWNFFGAGVLGFLINLPIVSYYEIGTALTANHGHAAFMGVYGMLAIGLALFCLRYIVPEKKWSEKAARISFWSTNIGLAWMVFVTLFPLGVMQLYTSVGKGYFAAREASFNTGFASLLEWARLPGDLLFIIGGVLPLLWLCVKGVMSFRAKATVEEPEEVLYAQS